MKNAAQKVIEALGLTASSQSDHAWLFSLLMFMATSPDDWESGDTYPSNPAREVYFRMVARGVGPFTLDKVKFLLNTLECEYDRTRQP